MFCFRVFQKMLECFCDDTWTANFTGTYSNYVFKQKFAIIFWFREIMISILPDLVPKVTSNIGSNLHKSNSKSDKLLTWHDRSTNFVNTKFSSFLEFIELKKKKKKNRNSESNSEFPTKQNKSCVQTHKAISNCNSNNF